jgi:hypothetical protein
MFAWFGITPSLDQNRYQLSKIGSCAPLPRSVVPERPPGYDFTGVLNDHTIDILTVG